MPRNRKDSLQSNARRLRKQMTEGEKCLWRELRLFRSNYGVHVRRQVPIAEFITDFAILKQRLVIEVDGEHHFTNQGLARDEKRDKRLTELGYRVLRINTGELADNLDGCIETILRELGITK